MVSTEREISHYLTELRALRRELAARRAVDGWLLGGGPFGRRTVSRTEDGAMLAEDEDGNRWEAPSYPALAAALGLEVDGE